MKTIAVIVEGMAQRIIRATCSVLRCLRECLEVFHGVKIQDSALVPAATLSHCHITDRFLTSNIGSEHLLDSAAVHGEIPRPGDGRSIPCTARGRCAGSSPTHRSLPLNPMMITR